MSAKSAKMGLWRYSRHPNYFFESLLWWAFFLAALPSPYGWTAVTCPLLMLCFLFKVTGIPLTEEYCAEEEGRCLPVLSTNDEPIYPMVQKNMISLDLLLEKNVLPDPLIRTGIRRMMAGKIREETRSNVEEQKAALMAHVEELRQSPIAIETRAANEQHYEVPTRFFQWVLGPRLKYSCALWPGGNHAWSRRG